MMLQCLPQNAHLLTHQSGAQYHPTHIQPRAAQFLCCRCTWSCKGMMAAQGLSCCPPILETSKKERQPPSPWTRWCVWAASGPSRSVQMDVACSPAGGSGDQASVVKLLSADEREQACWCMHVQHAVVQGSEVWQVVLLHLSMTLKVTLHAQHVCEELTGHGRHPQWLQ